MIEPITTSTKPAGADTGRPDAVAGADFAAVFAGESRQRPLRGLPDRATDDPAIVGQDVNLAALAAHQLTTQGAPRAEVAAAEKEMRSPSDKPALAGSEHREVGGPRPGLAKAHPEQRSPDSPKPSGPSNGSEDASAPSEPGQRPAATSGDSAKSDVG